MSFYVANELTSMGFNAVGWIKWTDKQTIETHVQQQFTKLSKCVYLFVIGDEIVRVGKRTDTLGSRIRDYQRDINKRLSGFNSPTKQPEADGWRDRLIAAKGEGVIWAKSGTIVTTSVGTFNAYTSEEESLISKYRPPLNNRRA